MINLKILWIFYRKLLIPGVLFSLLTSFPNGFSINSFGLSFLLIFPLMHYFIYELRFKREYLFFANFGFSKLFLWGLTISLSLIINIITKFYEHITY